MNISRKSETLIVSDNLIAERTRRFGLSRWSIWKISDVLASRTPWTLKALFCAQTGHDAMAMMESFERRTPPVK